MDVGTDGAERHVEALGDLLVRQVLQEGEAQHLVLGRTQQGEGVMHDDGGHHGADRQIDLDVQRNAAFERRGYRNITVSSSDARRGFTRVIVEVRRHLGDAGDLSRKESEWGVNGTSERPLT